MTPQLLLAIGLVLVAAAIAILRTYGPRYRVARLLATTPAASLEEAIAAAGTALPRYLRVEGRIDSETAFEDAARRPLVFRRTRLQARRGARWVTVEDGREQVAFEVGGTTSGQADGGTKKGTYVELGVGPSVAAGKASIAVPIKIGLSASDYYEFGTGKDGKFGYFSIAGIATLPAGPHWNVHGGVELQAYGDKLRAYNAFGDDGDRATDAVVSIGLGFSY